MIVTETPLRISFAGGGTDLPEYYREHGGCVLNCAINKYIYIIVKERYDDKIYVGATNREIVDEVGEIRHELVREALRMANITGGIEVSAMADIPSEGSGLGSSSAFTVGLLNAFFAFTGSQLTARELAERACRIELDILDRPMGKQDAYITSFGGLCQLRFGPGEEVQVKRLQLNGNHRRELERNMMLFFTGITRQSAPILSEQRRNIAENLAQHHRLRDLALSLSTDVESGAIGAVGPVLRDGWEAKRTLASGIDNDTTKEIVNLALDAGADGAKVCGAGGGGFVLVVCTPEHQSPVREALRDYREMPIRVARFGSRVVFNIHQEAWD